jgi:hypothetical protein
MNVMRADYQESAVISGAHYATTSAAVPDLRRSEADDYANVIPGASETSELGNHGDAMQIKQKKRPACTGLCCVGAVTSQL